MISIRHSAGAPAAPGATEAPGALDVPGAPHGLQGAVASGMRALERALDELAAIDLLELPPAELAAATVAMQRLADRARVVLAGFVAHADRAAVWQGSGSRDAAGWLAGVTGSAYGRTADLLRLADTVAASPAVADRLASGELSIDTATCLHRAVVAPPDTAVADDVDRLVERCVGLAPAAARRVVDEWRDELSNADPAHLERIRHERRAVHIRPPEDGMVLITAQLPTLDAHRLRKVVASYAGRPSDDDRRTTPQRLADGLMALVDSAGSVGGEGGAGAGAGDGASAGDVRRVGGARDAVSRGRTRPVLLVTIDVASLVGTDDRPGVDEFGSRIPAHVVRGLAGRADLQRLVHAAGRVLDLGRAVRLATDDQYRALVARDGGCRWPGCDRPASWCEVDHLVPWSAGGRTDLANLVLWCTAHHAEKHRAGCEVIGDADDLSIRRPDGVVMRCPPRGILAA
ncbi:MAG: DUF222 domain-containing protein [Ilumatobacteraceae bacterium]